MAKQYWLMKSEPHVYSIEDLERDGSTCWEGVRNYKARNNMRSMKRGDEVLYYHSNAKPPGVVGIARVCRRHTQIIMHLIRMVTTSTLSLVQMIHAGGWWISNLFRRSGMLMRHSACLTSRQTLAWLIWNSLDMGAFQCSQ